MEMLWLGAALLFLLTAGALFDWPRWWWALDFATGVEPGFWQGSANTPTKVAIGRNFVVAGAATLPR